MGSRTHWALGGYNPQDRLSKTELMLADIFDVNMSQIYSSGGMKKRPAAYPRPQSKETIKKKEDVTASAAVKRFLGKL